MSYLFFYYNFYNFIYFKILLFKEYLKNFFKYSVLKFFDFIFNYKSNVKQKTNCNQTNCNQTNYNHLKLRYFCCFASLICFIFLFSFSSISYCATPKIVNKLTSAFEDIEDWLIKLSTPAAAVAVGVGLFMKKFSFGDEERIRMSKKIIRGSLISYAMLLAVNLILAAIKSLVS